MGKSEFHEFFPISLSMISAKTLGSSMTKPLKILAASSAHLCTNSPPAAAAAIGDKVVSKRANGLSEERKRVIRRREYRFAYPEFLPDCERLYRNHTRELLERRD